MFQSETRKPKFLQGSSQAKVGSNSWEFSWEGLLNEATKHDIQYWLYMEWLMISQAALLMPQSNPRKLNLQVTWLTFRAHPYVLKTFVSFTTQ